MGERRNLPHRHSALEVTPTSVPCMWAVDSDPYTSRALWTRGEATPSGESGQTPPQPVMSSGEQVPSTKGEE